MCADPFPPPLLYLNAVPLGQPDDIGRAAVYLASDDSSFVTGKILRVDGGAWM
jgi:NAD(P)-dependent dehydrogenase (short-subunit alcohol dehydrogenase family)